MMCKALWMIALVALGACRPEAAEDPQGLTLTETARAECQAGGGSVGRGGLMEREICFTPTPDAGKSCSRASECSGHCLAETRTCSTLEPNLGCFDFLDDKGQVQGICVD